MFMNDESKEQKVVANTEDQENVIVIKDKLNNDKNNGSKKNKLKKTIYIDTPLRIFVHVGFIVIFIMLSMIFLKNALATKKYTSLYYNEKSNLDYKVYLKENPYFDEPYLGKGNQYIATLIDYVDVTFNYNFNASDLLRIINIQMLVSSIYFMEVLPFLPDNHLRDHQP